MSECYVKSLTVAGPLKCIPKFCGYDDTILVESLFGVDKYEREKESRNPRRFNRQGTRNRSSCRRERFGNVIRSSNQRIPSPALGAFL